MAPTLPSLYVLLRMLRVKAPGVSISKAECLCEEHCAALIHWFCAMSVPCHTIYSANQGRWGRGWAGSEGIIFAEHLLCASTVLGLFTLLNPQPALGASQPECDNWIHLSAVWAWICLQMRLSSILCLLFPSLLACISSPSSACTYLPSLVYNIVLLGKQIAMQFGGASCVLSLLCSQKQSQRTEKRGQGSSSFGAFGMDPLLAQLWTWGM